MAQNYDIDHDADIAKRAIRAIIARVDGVWDQPDLVAFGPLSTSVKDDIIEIARQARCYLSDEE